VQGRDGVEQLAAMPDKSDTKLLQVLRGQIPQDGVIDFIVAENRPILFEAQPSQPAADVHGVTLRADRCMILQRKPSV
jgi:hypothetical protein